MLARPDTSSRRGTTQADGPGTVTERHRRHVGSGHTPGPAPVADAVAEDVAATDVAVCGVPYRLSL